VACVTCGLMVGNVIGMCDIRDTFSCKGSPYHMIAVTATDTAHWHSKCGVYRRMKARLLRDTLYLQHVTREQASGFKDGEEMRT
jgi:hypothetical protein